MKVLKINGFVVFNNIIIKNYHVLYLGNLFLQPYVKHVRQNTTFS